jgi:ERCC4-type nuclease
MLLSLPGIDAKNFKAVMSQVSSIAELSRMNIHQLTPLIGPLNAKKLFDFFRKRI